MAILQTKFKLSDDGWTLVRTISDRGMMIRQDETGELYAEAIDPEFTHRTYTETETPIPQDINPDFTSPQDNEPENPEEGE